MRSIRNWKQFRKYVRSSERDLLSALERYPESVLVSGCQRSGTTMLTRIIANSDGFGRFHLTSDDELDAALILSGHAGPLSPGRYCFQTTYMYDCLSEYIAHRGSYKMIWMLRNPYSVVYSMLYNWKRAALNELFMAVGVPYLREPYRRRLQRFGALGVPALERACLSFRGKLEELFYLRKSLDNSDMFVVDYDELARNKNELLPEIFRFIGVEYREPYGERLKAASIDKASKLSATERSRIAAIAEPIYQEARALLSI